MNGERTVAVSETDVQAEAKSWFIPVPRGGMSYTAELGYYDRNDQWRTIATSKSTQTPPEALSEDRAAHFATVPPEMPLVRLSEPEAPAAEAAPQLSDVLEPAVRGDAPPIEPVQQWTAEQRAEPLAITPPPLPESKEHPRVAPTSRLPAAPAPAWSPEQARALQEIIPLDESRRVWMGSLEITELLRRHLREEVSSPAGGEQMQGPVARELAGEWPSSPLGLGEVAAAGGRSFWMNVNAELVLYGATDPRASVTVGGRLIRLRQDGTFSFRFALPDGEYPLEITATSSDQLDRRSVRLRFARQTQIQGEVGVHPQHPHLKPAVPANIA
jgi:hypothetical protein